MLIVDEHAVIRKQLKRLFEELGCENVLESAQVEAALTQLQETPIDFVICDIFMRHGAGMKILEAIRNRDMENDIPIVAISGESSDTSVVKAADFGINGYIIKPFQSNEAKEKITAALNKYFTPTEFDAAIRVGDRNFRLKRFAEAKSAYEAAISLNSSSAQAYCNLARVLKAQGEKEKSLIILQDNIKRNENYYRTHRLLADFALESRNFEEAIVHLEKELALHSKQPKRQAKVAALHLKLKNPEPAIEHYRQALVEDPKCQDALIGMAHAYYQIDNLDKSIYYFKRARKHYPKENSILNSVVKFCLSHNNPRKAELFLRDEKNSDLRNEDIYLVLTKLLMFQEKTSEALKVIEELLRINPNNAHGLHFKALIFLKLKDFKQATIVLEALVDIRKNVKDFNLLAKCYLQLDRLEDAEHTLERALQSKNDQAATRATLLKVFVRQKQPYKAYFINGASSPIRERNQTNTEDLHLQINNMIQIRRQNRGRIAS